MNTNWKLVEVMRVPAGERARAVGDHPLSPPIVTVWETLYRWEAQIQVFTKTPEPPKTEDESAELKELRRKANCWDMLLEARNAAWRAPESSWWKMVAKEKGLIEGCKACRAELGISLSEARDCVEGYLSGLKKE